MIHQRGVSRKKPPSLRRRRPVTVCIAAICRGAAQAGRDFSMVVAASDRMLTSGDIEYEPPVTKITQFTTPRIVALAAGDAAIYFEVCKRTYNEVWKQTITSVEAVAYSYARHFASYRMEMVEKHILGVMGLSFAGFYGAQHQMSAAMVDDLSSKLRDFSLDHEAIIAGTDSNGAHIFVIENPGLVVDNSGIGFVAIGYGERHAESEFMFSRYTRDWLVPRALLLTYRAKRRAEVAPSVGKETDIIIIPPTGATQRLPDNLVAEIQKIYDDTKRTEDLAGEKGYEKIEKFVRRLTKSQKPPNQAAPSSEPPGPSESPPPTSPPRSRRRRRR